MSRAFYLVGAFIIFITFQSVEARESWVLDGFDMPESVLVDAERERLIVSNIVGHPGERDAIGYLSLLSFDGTLLERHWVSGLHAPKGMAFVGQEILVTDLDRLHIIDAATGVIVKSLVIEGAIFLNDVTSKGNSAWISDLMTNTIWQYSEGEVLPWLQHDALSHPNGLIIDTQRLLVGSWGTGLNDDFSTDEPGALLSVDLASKSISTIVDSIGNIDGIAVIEEDIYVSDWISGQLFEINEAEKIAVERKRFSKGLADISAAGEILYLPMMLDGQVKEQLASDWSDK